MPRPRSFTPSAVVTEAMQLFWRSGYSKVSFDRLVAKTRASRYGLYSEFGGKNDLLLAALEVYISDVASRIFAPLEDPHASIPAIRQALQNALASIERNGDLGCLACNIAVELGQARTAPARRVREHFAWIHGLLLRALQNAQTTGAPGGAIEPAEGARYLLATFTGAHLLARAGMPIATIRALIQGALAYLGEHP